MDWHAYFLHLDLTLFAGLATGVGSAIAFFARTTNTRFLSVSLGFSAGVMIYVSLIEIFAKAKISLIGALGDRAGYWVTVASFFAGILLIAIIDRLVPEMENPHELKRIEEAEHPSEAFRKKKLLRMGMFSAMAIGIHNFPEGLATFTAALKRSYTWYCHCSCHCHSQYSRRHCRIGSGILCHRK